LVAAILAPLSFVVRDKFCRARLALPPSPADGSPDVAFGAIHRVCLADVLDGFTVAVALAGGATV
jgi:hypothetical protein